MTESPPLPRIGFFTSPPHPCGYLAGRNAVTLFADPRLRLTTEAYTRLSAHGFRRSGAHVYRPHCGSCQACIAVRVAVDAFRPRRSQRRTLAQNADVEVRERPARFDPEHYALYVEYMRARHPASQMDAAIRRLSRLPDQGGARPPSEFRRAELPAVAVVDKLDDGLSPPTPSSPRGVARNLSRQPCSARSRPRRRPALGLSRLLDADCRKMRYRPVRAARVLPRRARHPAPPSPN